MIESFAAMVGGSGSAGVLGEFRYRPRLPISYEYHSYPLPRVELPRFDITAFPDMRYPTLEEQEIMRRALWKSAKVIRQSPAIKR